jgi:predicted TIM-barrel fold metal-dependent hydrolase
MPLPPDARLVSINDHLVEPGGLWAARTTAAADVPRVRALGDGAQAWCIGSERIDIARLGIIAAAGPDQPDRRATRVEEFHPAVGEPAARLVAMDRDGVAAHTLLPHVIGFAGERLRFLADGAAWTHAVQVYNDFLLGEFCAHAPSRLAGIALVPLHDVAAAVAELERAAALGARGVSFPHDPVSLGLPSLYTGRWDPLFAAAEGAGLPVLVHIGTGDNPVTADADGPAPSVGTLLTLGGLDVAHVAVDLLYAHVLTRHPRLRVVLLEGGVAWIPYITERVEFFLRRAGTWPAGEVPDPVALLARGVAASFIEDRTGLALRDQIGADRMLWQSDFPHADSFWPESRARLAAQLAEVPDDVAAAIAGGNARSLLGIDPPAVSSGPERA